MQVKDIRSFQEYVFQKLTFQSFTKENHTLYTNPSHPELGYCYIYQRANSNQRGEYYQQADYYQFGIADYTIPEDFSVHFHNTTRQLRLGTMMAGKTHFKLSDTPASSFLPSSFLVMEENIRGQQIWKAGEHLQGIELTIFEPYMRDIVLPLFPDIFTFDSFMANYTYHFLPVGVLQIIGRLSELHERRQLSPLFLEGLILECIAILNEDIRNRHGNFVHTRQAEHIPMGANRFLTIHEEDKAAVRRAHDILSDTFRNPPTIQALSEQVLLSPQKLKYAFAAQYHMGIYEYTLSLKMAHAAMLLSTTSMSIDAIANEVGYHYSGSFIQAFKKTYGQTPLKFRKSIPD